jgi:hypothetical protein
MAPIIAAANKYFLIFSSSVAEVGEMLTAPISFPTEPLVSYARDKKPAGGGASLLVPSAMPKPGRSAMERRAAKAMHLEVARSQPNEKARSRPNEKGGLLKDNQQRQSADQRNKRRGCRHKAYLFKGGHDAPLPNIGAWGKIKMAILYLSVRCRIFPQKKLWDVSKSETSNVQRRLSGV